MVLDLLPPLQQNKSTQTTDGTQPRLHLFPRATFLPLEDLSKEGGRPFPSHPPPHVPPVLLRKELQLEPRGSSQLERNVFTIHIPYAAASSSGVHFRSSFGALACIPTRLLLCWQSGSVKCTYPTQSPTDPLGVCCVQFRRVFPFLFTGHMFTCAPQSVAPNSLPLE